MTTTTSSASGSRTQLTRPDGSALRVLVVDDEPAICELLSMALRYEGWDVRTAPDGTEAVRTARDFRPDAVVLDVMLPDMDGLDPVSLTAAVSVALTRPMPRPADRAWRAEQAEAVRRVHAEVYAQVAADRSWV